MRVRLHTRRLRQKRTRRSLKNHQPEMLDKDVSARLAKIVEAAAK